MPDLMRVRMKQTRVGPTIYQKAGVEYEVPTWEAMSLIDTGAAEPVLATAGQRTRADWEQRMKIAPEDYLRRFPNGPNAAWARALVQQ